LRNDYSLEYKERKTHLDKKKEKLWNEGDIHKWQIDQDKLDTGLVEVSGDKVLAKKHMLAKVKVKYFAILSFL
jgi:hypothetical protein